MSEQRNALQVLVDELPATILHKQVVARRLLQALWDEGYRLTRRSEQYIEVRFQSPKENRRGYGR